MAKSGQAESRKSVDEEEEKRVAEESRARAMITTPEGEEGEAKYRRNPKKMITDNKLR